MKVRHWLFAAAALAISAGAAQAQDRKVNVYNWSDYIDDTAIAEFEKETGIKVVYDTFDSNEVLETKLLTGGFRLLSGGADRQLHAAPVSRPRAPEARSQQDSELEQLFARYRLAQRGL